MQVGTDAAERHGAAPGLEPFIEEVAAFSEASGKKILEIVMKHMLAWLEEYRTWPIDARKDQHRQPPAKEVRW